MWLNKGVEAELGVVPALDASADSLDGRDGGLGGAADDEVYRGGEVAFSLCEDLDAIAQAVDAARVVELADRDGLRGVKEAAVDPVLDAVQVDWDEGLGVHVGKATLGVPPCQGGLASLKSRNWLAVARARLLALVTTGRRATAAGGGSATQSLAL